jgi:hypothetical protein
MKNKEYPINSAVAAEIEALYQEIADLKKAITDLQIVVATLIKKD